MTFEYEGVRRVAYGGADDDEAGVAVFVPVCPTCGRFVRRDPTITYGGPYGQPVEPNATCRRCGRVAMPFEGFFSAEEVSHGAG